MSRLFHLFGRWDCSVLHSPVQGRADNRPVLSNTSRNAGLDPNTMRSRRVGSKHPVALPLAWALFTVIGCTVRDPAPDASGMDTFPVRRAYKRDPAKLDHRLVSVVVLLTRPEVFHARRVQVEGWLDPTFEGVALYLSRDAATHGAHEYGLALSGVSRTSLQGFSPGDFVRVEGLYRSGDSGHENLWPGGISVTSLVAASSPR